MRNLANEGITNGVHLVGDVMVDALHFNREIARKNSSIQGRLGLIEKAYLVVTVHRPANTDNRANLENIIGALGEAGCPVIFPLHPRTRKYLSDYGMLDALPASILVTEPLGYLDMLRLMDGAEKIATDSGGVQKEAYLLGVPCITLRENTEWVETVEDGWNVLVGADRGKIVEAIREFEPAGLQREVFGTVGASGRIVRVIGRSR